MRLRAAVLLLATAPALPTTSPPAAAQEPAPVDVGLALGRVIGAAVVLAADDFLASGRYTVDDGAADSEFTLRGVGFRHDFRASDAALRPALKLHVGRSTFDERITAFGEPFEDAVTTTDVIEVEVLLRRTFANGLFVEPFLGVIDSRTRQETTRRNALRVALAPILDGRILDWQASTWTVTGGLTAGVQRRGPAGGWLEAAVGVTAARTDPRTTDDPLQDVSVSTLLERVRLGLGRPLAARPWGRPLRLELGATTTWLDDDLSIPLDSGHLLELRGAIVALDPSAGRLPWPPALGLAVTYTRASAFEGWSFGVVVSR